MSGSNLFFHSSSHGHHQHGQVALKQNPMSYAGIEQTRKNVFLFVGNGNEVDVVRVDKLLECIEMLIKFQVNIVKLGERIVLTAILQQLRARLHRPTFIFGVNHRNDVDCDIVELHEMSELVKRQNILRNEIAEKHHVSNGTQ